MTSFEKAMDGDYDAKKYSISSRFKRLYLTNHFEKTIKKRPIIPRHIHQIWIGGPVPDTFKKLAKTWQEKHPNFKYTLWTDESLKTFKFSHCGEAFKRAQTMGAKVDILRYEIIYQFGGVYFDIDFECVKSIDPLVRSHSFFTGIGGHDYVANSVIGATANHPLLERLLKHLEHKSQEALNNPWYETGPKFFTYHVYHYLRKKQGGVIVYPTRYFHPLPNTYRFDYRADKLSKRFIERFFIPETFAVHYWAESWVGK